MHEQTSLHAHVRTYVHACTCAYVRACACVKVLLTILASLQYTCRSLPEAGLQTARIVIHILAVSLHPCSILSPVHLEAIMGMMTWAEG